MCPLLRHFYFYWERRKIPSKTPFFAMKFATFAPFVYCIIGLRGSNIHAETRRLKVAGLGSKPYLNLDEFQEGLPTGAEMDILKILANKFDYNLTFEPSNAWGLRLSNGSFTGTIGKVLNAEADIGVGHISVTRERHQVLHFSNVLDTQHFIIHGRKPLPLPVHFNLIKPFTIEVWALLLASLASLSLVLTFINSSCSGFKSGSDDLQRAVIIYIELWGTVLNQSRPLHFLKGGKCVTFLLSWLIFVTLMPMFYDCNFKAYLTSVDYEDEVNTVEDCIKMGKKLHLLKGAITTEMLQHFENPAMKQLLTEAIENERYFSFKSEIPLSLDKKMIDEDAVVFLPEMFYWNRLDTLRETFGSIPIRMGTQSILFVFSAIVFQKESEVYHKFNSPMLHLIDCGIVRKLINDNQSEDKERKVSDAEAPLALEHFFMAILLYCIMMALSGFLMLYELKTVDLKHKAA